MQSVFELRYQVYCLERGFLSAADCPDGIETDEFDDISDHFCEFDDIGAVIGYARLVKANAVRSFPFQHHCATVLDGVSLPPPGRAAEVSRLIVRSDYRRPRAAAPEGASATRAGAHGRGNKRDAEAQLVVPRLYRQMVIHSLTSGTRYWYAAMERILARSLLQMNYPFKQITPVVDYYGPVATYLLDMEELQDRLALRNPEHLSWLTTADTEAVPGSMPPKIAPVRSRVPPARHEVGGIVGPRSTSIGGRGLHLIATPID